MTILHTFQHFSSFVKKDQTVFESFAKVKSYEFKVRKKWELPYILIRQFFYLLFNSRTVDVFVTQFAGYHSLLPCLFARMLGKKAIIISGGTDCVKFTGIKYGNFYKPILRDFTRWSYTLCTWIAPKHQSLWFSPYQYDKKEPNQQGIKAFVPLLENKSVIINNGYEAEKWPLLNLTRKTNSFITVSGAFEYPFQIQLKGIDLILEIAAEFPEYSFTILGVPAWKKLDIRSDNILVLPPVSNSELYPIFNSHQYYLQLSMAEGFPNALCEAMLCGCTPIVSNVFSMPDIIGETGYILNKRDIAELKSVFSNLTTPGDPARSRKRIEENYTLENRKRELQKLLLT